MQKNLGCGSKNLGLGTFENASFFFRVRVRLRKLMYMYVLFLSLLYEVCTVPRRLCITLCDLLRKCRDYEHVTQLFFLLQLPHALLENHLMVPRDCVSYTLHTHVEYVLWVNIE